MARVLRTGEFFVVGGPVQPDRPCYIERASDLALQQSIEEQQFSYVLSPRASGKSSLMARTVKTLRGERQLAAVVDLAQIGARGEAAEPGPWYYSIAYRILRELRLKVELQSWWQEKSVLMGEQRLTEFFWEIVLANTTAPVTIFFDEIERALELPFSRQLFAAIKACYSGRATEPDFERLNFVVLGVASPRLLCPDSTLSPFEDGRAIELGDFTLEQTYGLAAGFGGDPRQARALLDRIYSWAGGHPYLTQKIARGVSRPGGTADDVDRVVRERFLGPGALREEPLLNHIRTLLTQRAPYARQALVLLGKIGKGAQIFHDPDSATQQALHLAGVVSSGAEGQLTFRNRLFASVFTSRWVSSALPFDWRGSSVAAVLVLGMLLVPLWYTQYLPRPYIQTLSVVTQDFEVAMDAYDRLGRLPGFAGTADRLLAGVMSRRSREAQTYAEARSADVMLRRLSEYEALADGLMGEYWLRRARQSMRSEHRDEALVLTAAALAGQPEAAGVLAAELIGSDYPSLLKSFRLAEAPVRWEVDWTSQELTLVDPAHRVWRLPLGDGVSRQTEQRLTALQHVPVSREVSVDVPGSAGTFALGLELAHPANAQLLLSLQSPSGARATFTLDPESTGTMELVASGRSPLASLADEERQGVWRLTLVDQRVGDVGQLIRWGLHFAEELRGWEDAPEQGLEIPDPVRTEQVEVELSTDGAFAVVRPSRSGSVGAIALWDLRTGAPASDLQLEAEPEFLALTGDTSRVLAVAGNTLSLWDVGEAGPLARVATQTGFLLSPAVALDGDYVAIAEQLEVQGSLFSLLRTSDGELVASIAGLGDVTGWVLGPQARYLALLGPSRRVRIIDPRSGDMRMELPLERDLVRILPVPEGDQLLTVDDAGGIVSWEVGANGDTTANPVGRHLGVTVAAESVSVASDGSVIAFELLRGQVVVRGLAGDRETVSFRIHEGGFPTETRLAPDGSSLVTASGALVQLWRVEHGGPAAVKDTGFSALALDRSGQLAALGFRDGRVRMRPSRQLLSSTASEEDVDFIGHRGGVTSIAIDAEHGTIISGGVDGVVRLWNLVTGAPTDSFMRHPQGPIRAVALSADGRWVVSAAEYSARVWDKESSELSVEVPVNGAALSVAFSEDSTVVAVGDSAGNVFLTSPTGVDPVRSTRSQAAVAALAFAPARELLATGDVTGQIQLWDPRTVGRVGNPYQFPHPVRWVGFNENGQFLLAQTNHWVHRLAIGPQGLNVVASRLLEVGLEAGAALASPGGNQIRLVGGRGVIPPRFYELDLARPGTVALPADSPLLARDWPRVLGLGVDETGRVTPIQP